MINLTQWLQDQVQKVLHLDDQPDRIALGAAAGFFWGFTPLFGLKTLLSIGTVWLVRGNYIAAVVAVSLHDLVLPFMPVLLRVEYQIGFWILSSPHHLPPPLRPRTLDFHEWWSWTTFLNVGEPILLGSMVLGLPVALVSYFLVHGATTRYRGRGAASTETKA